MGKESMLLRSFSSSGHGRILQPNNDNPPDNDNNKEEPAATNAWPLTEFGIRWSSTQVTIEDASSTLDELWIDYLEENLPWKNIDIVDWTSESTSSSSNQDEEGDESILTVFTGSVVFTDVTVMPSDAETVDQEQRTILENLQPLQDYVDWWGLKLQVLEVVWEPSQIENNKDDENDNDNEEDVTSSPSDPENSDTTAVALLLFSVLVTAPNGGVPVGELTLTLQDYLLSTMLFPNALQSVTLEIVEGDTVEGQYGLTATALRFGGRATFLSENLPPLEEVRSEQMYVLQPPQAVDAIQKAVSQNPALQGTDIVKVTFDSVSAAAAFHSPSNSSSASEEEKGLISDSQTITILVSAIVGVSFMLILGVTVWMMMVVRRKKSKDRDVDSYDGEDDEEEDGKTPPLTPDLTGTPATVVIATPISAKDTSSSNKIKSPLATATTAPATSLSPSPDSPGRPREISFSGDDDEEGDDDDDDDILTLDTSLRNHEAYSARNHEPHVARNNNYAPYSARQ
jgi:hypothetical protein